MSSPNLNNVVDRFVLDLHVFVFCSVIKMSSPNLNNVVDRFVLDLHVFVFCSVIKMSSPNLNNVILVGCVLTFMTIFFHEQTISFTRAFCTV